MQITRWSIIITLLYQVLIHANPPAAGTLDTTFNPNGAQPGTLSTTLNNFFSSNSFGSNYAQILIQNDNKIIVTGTAYDGSNYYMVAGRFNVDGSLDTTFNPAGAQPGTFGLPLINGNSNYCYASVLQSDGKIILAGYIYDTNSIDSFAAIRLNTDGTLDTTFNPSGTLSGTPGIAVSEIGGANAYAYGVTLQSTGKIVLAGGSYNNQTVMTRFNVDGSVDTSFGITGVVSLPNINGIAAEAYAVTTQVDDALVIAGYAYILASPSGTTFMIARFTPDGTLDATFNSSGLNSNLPGVVVTTIDGNAETNYAYAVLMQRDGKILAAGTYYGDYGMGIVRLNSDGSLDTSFNPQDIQPGTAQVFVNSSNGNYSGAFAIALQNDNSIVLAGYGYPAPLFNYNFAIARLTPQGIMDQTLNPLVVNPGSTMTNINEWIAYSNAYGVAIQKDGKIITSGIASDRTANYYFALARFNGVSTTNKYSNDLIDKYSLQI